MKVIHIGNYKPESANGVNKTIAGLVKYLYTEGINVELWHFTSKVNEIKDRKIDGIQIFDLPYFSSQILNLFTFPKSTQKFLRERQKKVDLLHLHSVFRIDNIKVSQVSGLPYIITPHSGYNPQVLQGRNRLLKTIWIKLLEKKYLSNARLIHAVSDLEIPYIQNIIKTTKIRCIPNGIDDEFLLLPKVKCQERLTWVYLGRLAIQHKGIDLLLKGYAILAKNFKKKLPLLIIAGPDFRDDLAKLKILAHNLGISDSVKFEGPLFGQDKITLLQQAQIFIHTSRWEGMPFSVLEALALGKPVLVTPETNLAGYVEKYNAGWVVQGTPEAIAEGLLKVLNTSTNEFNVIGENSYLLIKKNFTWSVIVSKMAKIYKEILS
ncbi:MAG: glycosyltransferase [Candidatus Eremiobacterota bacterium]